MRKHRKLLIGLLLVAVILALHFVPVDSRVGYIDVNKGSAENLPTINYTYRWISGGVNAWDDQLSKLHEGIQLDTLQEQQVHLRLYLL